MSSARHPALHRVRHLAFLLAALVACGREATAPPAPAPATERSFEEELVLVVRAGRGELSDTERQALAKEGHPLLGQLGDPDTAKLIRLFARLPDPLHSRLEAEGYLKWSFAELDDERQRVVREIVQVNLDLAARQGNQPQPGFSLEALELAETGFAVVEIEETGQKVVSWFLLWPELPSPTWVTVVNARAAGTQPYFQTHLRHLPSLRGSPASPPPGKAS